MTLESFLHQLGDLVRTQEGMIAVGAIGTVLALLLITGK